MGRAGGGPAGGSFAARGRLSAPTYAITGAELEAIAVHVRELRDRVERVCRERIAAMG
jgi:hypothetical protein